MKALVYPLLASALITIVPFLLTFEKGQDIVRGLFGFEYFSILLLFLAFKNFKTNSLLKKVVRNVFLISLVFLLVVLAFVDLSNLLAIKESSLGFYGVLPFITCAFAFVMVFKVPAFGTRGISFILFVTLVAHLAFKNFYPSQPLMQLPLVDYLSRISEKKDNRVPLDSFKEKYSVTDSVTITKNFVDYSKTNVVVLVESWGIPISEEKFENQLALFKDIPHKVGVHGRMYSRTRTAEREDWISTVRKDSLKKDTLFIPQIADSLGVKTVFFFGGDSLEQWRFRYLRNAGFKEICFANFFGDSLKEVNDKRVLLEIENRLQDSSMQFISWTTRDTRFPIEAASVEALDSIYSEKLICTLKGIADLAKRFPNVRFIVQGDHEPILSPVPFQEKFYKRFVPYVVLN